MHFASQVFGEMSVYPENLRVFDKVEQIDESCKEMINRTKIKKIEKHWELLRNIAFL